MTKFTVDVVTDYVTPEGPLETDEAYLEFVINYAAASYQRQYGTETPELGIEAARLAYNETVKPVTGGTQ